MLHYLYPSDHKISMRSEISAPIIVEKRNFDKRKPNNKRGMNSVSLPVLPKSAVTRVQSVDPESKTELRISTSDATKKQKNNQSKSQIDFLKNQINQNELIKASGKCFKGMSKDLGIMNTIIKVRNTVKLGLL